MDLNYNLAPLQPALPIFYAVRAPIFSFRCEKFEKCVRKNAEDGHG